MEKSEHLIALIWSFAMVYLEWIKIDGSDSSLMVKFLATLIAMITYYILAAVAIGIINFIKGIFN
ncbi:hypothetical protein [Oceanobacillus oncorhynchi]|uniref:hypothetical protein n=1 Tax=Oceanobacillus oncorhynchi TaxID=545501 RepID=UPI0034D66BB5